MRERRDIAKASAQIGRDTAGGDVATGLTRRHTLSYDGLPKYQPSGAAMPLNFLDLCIIQAMSSPDASQADDSESARQKWTTRVIHRAQALDAARQVMGEQSAESESEQVKRELATRSAIS